MISIEEIYAWQIFDSIGFPTLAGSLKLTNGQTVFASVPSTYSQGKRFVYELRDQKKEEFDGFGVKKAVYYINSLIAPKLKGVNPQKQREIDYWLIKADNTPNKSVLGGNTLLLVSTLIAKAGAASLGLPLFIYLNRLYNNIFKETLNLSDLPQPIFNIVDGGRHAHTVNFQEYYVFFPKSDSLLTTLNQFFYFKKEIEENLLARAVGISFGNFGGYAPNFNTNLDAYEIIKEVIFMLNNVNGVDIFLGTDFSADNYYQNDNYNLRDVSLLSKTKYYDYIKKIIDAYHLIYIEDPFSYVDLANWKKIYQEKNQEIYIASDFYTASGKNNLIELIKNKFANTVNIKPSYYGTISETFEIINLVKKNNLTLTIGSKSGDTDDSFVADLSVATQADFVKFGSLNRGERVVKYNRLLKIEEEMKKTS